MAKKRNYNPKPPKTKYRHQRKTKLEKWGGEYVDYEKKKAETSDQYTARLRKLLKEIRTQTARRLASLNKNKKFFSYAGYAFEQEMKKRYLKVPDVGQMSYQDVESELRMHHQFWASKTSTEKGMRDETLRQSERIFGVDSSGRLNRVMSREEGRRYWEVYYEFYNQKKTASSKYDSYRVQAILGEAMVMQNFENIDLVDFLDKLEETIEEDYNIDLKKRKENKMTREAIRESLKKKGVFSGGNDFSF